METVTKKLYEGMFLVDTADAISNWDGVVGEITGIIGKRGGEIVTLKKWDERKLAYEIDKKNRGTYILVYFNSETGAISAIERDIQLSEMIVRAMILSTARMSQEDINKPTPLETGSKPAVEDAGDVEEVEEVEEDN